MLTKATLEKLLAKARDTYAEKAKVTGANIQKLHGGEAEFVQANGRHQAAIDALMGPLEGYAELVTEGAYTQEECDALPEVIGLKEKLAAAQKTQKEYAASFATDMKALESQINTVELPELRRIAHKIEMYEEMVGAATTPSESAPVETPQAA